MIDFIFIQFYIRKKYNQKVEEYFNIGKQSVSDWRKNNEVPSKRLIEFNNKEGSLNTEELLFKIYKKTI
jgi:hypothetical protein